MRIYWKLRKKLIEEANEACSSCGYNKKRECGGWILEIDHIDGNHKNNDPANLRVLCPNCHALTPNFRNWGRRQSTRKFRSKEQKVADKFSIAPQSVNRYMKRLLPEFYTFNCFRKSTRKI